VPLAPIQVETVYRELRRGFESKSDMPGAADFYFGEMEMRRWCGRRSILERFFVWSYWALSGYGLKPGRALVAWLLIVSAGAAALVSFSLPLPTGPIGASQALLISVRASIPGFPSVPTADLVVQWIETALRVAGTVLIALFVLSARSIVMRKPGE
jgi:hypothetical protein